MPRGIQRHAAFAEQCLPWRDAAYVPYPHLSEEERAEAIARDEAGRRAQERFLMRKRLDTARELRGRNPEGSSPLLEALERDFPGEMYPPDDQDWEPRLAARRIAATPVVWREPDDDFPYFSGRLSTGGSEDDPYVEMFDDGEYGARVYAYQNEGDGGEMKEFGDIDSARAWAEEYLGGLPGQLDLFASRSAGIQDNTYPQSWMDTAEQLAHETGGFTIHDDPRLPGDAPETGYQVAITGPGLLDDTISTGAGWAGYGRGHQDVLNGPDRYMGTWLDDGGRFQTEPSERIHDYNDAGRATLDRYQDAMWDNAAFVIDPATGEKRWPMVSGPYGEDVPRAEITDEQVANEGVASALGFFPRARRMDL